MKDKMIGKCCNNLGLSVSPQELEMSYRKFIEEPINSETFPVLINDNDKRSIRDITPRYRDIFLLYPMLEFLYQDYIHPNGDVPVNHPIYHYRCKNLKNGRCSVYNIRPWMCLSFPNGGVCEYRGCKCPGDGRKEWAEKLKREKIKDKPHAGKECGFKKEEKYHLKQGKDRKEDKCS